MPEDEKDAPIDFALMIAQAKANVSRTVEIAEVLILEHEIKAKVLKSYYDALILVGFDKEQALKITIGHGWLGK